jgi:hypothetical protein
MIIHGFCPTIAERYGVNEALLFRHFCFCARLNPEGWFSKSVSELASEYPYLGRYEVWSAVKRLCSGTRKHPVLARRSTVGQRFVYRPYDEDDTGRYHTFSVELAVQLGVLPAVVYSNIRYWIGARWKDAVEEQAEKLEPGNYDFNSDLLNDDAFDLTRSQIKLTTTMENWADRHRYAPVRSVRRAFAVLVEHELIRKELNGRNQPVWRLPAKKMEEMKTNLLSFNNFVDDAAKTKRLRPKPNGCGQNQTVAAKTKRSDLSNLLVTNEQHRF